LIGREAELRQLQEAFETAVDEGERQMITIRAEAGVGKSRLLDEFITWLEVRPASTYYFKGRARQEMQSQAYSLLRDLFAFRFQIQESDRATEAQQKMEQGVAAALGPGDTSRMKAHILGKLLGFDLDDSSYLEGMLQDSQELRDRALVYLAEYFQALAAHYPVVILLEDIHWADDSSLDLLGRLALPADRQRLLIVCAARPDLWQRRPHWGEGQPWHGRCELRPLSKRDGRRLVTAILQKVANLPESLRDLVADKAEGNPYYAEELIRMLIEDGIILTGGDTWRVEPARLTDWRVPPTLTGILQARLDSLSPLERTELQRASVVGRIFWDDAVARLDESGRGRQTETLYDTFHALRRREMIFQRDPSAFAGTQEYIFKHALLREVTYESVLKRLRRVYHGLVAEWLMSRSGDRLEEYTGLIADHLEQAGRSAEAVPYLRRAGEQSQARFANAEAVAYLGRALALLPETAVAERYELLLAREAIYNLLGQRDAQTADLDTLEKLAETLGDNKRAEVMQCRAQYAEQMGDFARARAQLEQSLAIAQTLNNQIMAGDALYHLGVIASRRASYAVALEKLAQSLALARAVSDPLAESKILRAMGVVAWYQGHYAEAEAYYQQSLALARAAGHRRFESYCLGNLGLVASNSGDPGQAWVYHEQSLAISRAIGDRAAEGRTLNNLGETAYTVGDYKQGRAYLAESLAVARLVGNRPSENLALLNLAEVALALAEYETARASFAQVLATAQAIGDRRQQGGALQGLGNSALEEGRLQDANGHFQEAQQLWQELGLLRSLDAMIGLARVAYAQGVHTRALAWVEQTITILASQGEGDAHDPMRIYLTCYQVLQANGDRRAPGILRQAHALLQEQAARIPDEATRHSFLGNVLVHREILQAFAALSQEGE
jgi:tetratricopeptide (TPR) repeat protein